MEKPDVNLEDDQAIEYSVLPHDQFAVFSGRGGSDYGRVPTPAITYLLGKPELLASIVVDGGFLPSGNADKFCQILLYHETSEIEYVLNHSEFLEQARKDQKQGKMIDQSAHKAALVEEFKFAAIEGVLDEYFEHWDEWIKERMGEVDDPEIRTNLRQRIEQRAEAYENVKKEFLAEQEHLGPGVI